MAHPDLATASKRTRARALATPVAQIGGLSVEPTSPSATLLRLLDAGGPTPQALQHPVIADPVDGHDAPHAAEHDVEPVLVLLDPATASGRLIGSATSKPGCERAPHQVVVLQ